MTMTGWIRAALLGALAHAATHRITYRGAFYIEWYVAAHHLMDSAREAAP